MNRLSHNIFYNLAGQFGLAVIGLFAVKWVLRQLGSDAFGIFIFVQVMDATLATVLERGLASTTTREVANCGPTDPSVYRLLRTASLFYWCSFGLLAVLLYAAAPFVMRHWFHLTTMPADDAIYVFRVLGIASLLELPRSFYASLFRGLQRMEINNAVDVGALFVQQAGILAILFAGGALVHVVYWMALCFVLATLAFVVLAVPRFPAGALLPGYAAAAVNRNRSFASRMTAISVTAMVNTQVDKAVLGKYLPIGVVGYYGFAFSLVSSLKAFAGASALAAFPSFAGFSRDDRRGALVSQYRKLQDVNAVVNFLVFAGFAFVQYPVFAFFLNDDAARLLMIPTLLLCAGSYMNSIANIPYILSIAVGAPAIALRATVYAFLFVTPLTIVMTAFWGVLGASLGWLAFNIFGLLYTVPRICRECLGIPVGSGYASIAKVGALGVAICGLGFVVREAAGLQAFLPSAAFFSVSAIAFSAASYFFVFDRELQRTLMIYAGLTKRSHDLY